jgi:hypothetical protein
LADHSLDVLAERFGGVTRSAITETARRARLRAEREPAFAALLDEIRAGLRRTEFKIGGADGWETAEA